MNTSNKTQLSSISSASDLIDAKLEEHQLCGSKQCPGCGHKLEGSKPVSNTFLRIFYWDKIAEFISDK